jgi:membrane complex biogenesis BtpA family protein
VLGVFGVCKPLIGVIHLPPLPGSPGYRRVRFPDVGGNTWDFESVVEYAISQARVYESAGFDGVIVENYGDRPYSARVGVGQVASMSYIVGSVVKSVSIPVGVNMLRSSGYEAFYVAYVTGAKFIRVNNLCELRVSQEGILRPEARRLSKALSELGAYEDLYSGKLLVMADVNVKHSSPLVQIQGLQDLVRECIERCGIPLYSIIVTGTRTGEEPGYDRVEEVLPVAKDMGVQMYIGSGVNHTNISKYWNVADGFIVGTSVKIGGRTENPVSEEKAIALAKLVKHSREIVGCK